MGQLLIVTTHTSPIPWQNYTEKAVREHNVLNRFYSKLISFYNGTRKGNPQKIFLVPWFFVLLDIPFEIAEEPRLQPEGDCHQRAAQTDTQGLRRLIRGSSNLQTRKLQKHCKLKQFQIVEIQTTLWPVFAPVWQCGNLFLMFNLLCMNLESKSERLRFAGRICSLGRWRVPPPTLMSLVRGSHRSTSALQSPNSPLCASIRSKVVLLHNLKWPGMDLPACLLDGK